MRARARKVGASVHGSPQQLSCSNYLKIYPPPMNCTGAILQQVYLKQCKCKHTKQHAETNAHTPIQVLRHGKLSVALISLSSLSLKN